MYATFHCLYKKELKMLKRKYRQFRSWFKEDKKGSIFLMAAVFLGASILTCFGHSYALSTNSIRIADPPTMDTYQEALINDTNGSRYAGRIWADKSVFAVGNKCASFDGSTLTLDEDTDGISASVRTQSDFLHVFSTLGSSQTVHENIPLDVMFVLDVSSSMGIADVITDNDSAENTRIQRTLTAINDAIDTLMSSNAKNRVGVVVYGTFGRVLLPLGRYEPTKKTLKSTDGYLYDSSTNGSHTYVYADYFVRNTAVPAGDRRFNVISNATKIDEETGAKTKVVLEFRNAHLARQTVHGKVDTTEADAYIGPYTNQQAGWYLGTEVLASEKETTVKTLFSGRVSRIPVLFMMTDGGANTLTMPQTAQDWGSQWYAPMDTSQNKNVVGTHMFANDSNNAYNDASSSGVILSTMLTASLGTAAIKKNYNQNAYISTFSLDTTTNANSSWQGPRLRAIMNPSVRFTSLSEESAIQEAYQRFISFQNQDSTGLDGNGWSVLLQGGTTAQGGSFADAGERLSLKHLPDAYTFGNVQLSNQDVIDHILYVPKGNYYDINTVDLSTNLKKIMAELSSDTFSPVSGLNDSGVKDSITYMDPIGQYLELKEQSIGVAGNTYDLAVLHFGKLYGLKRLGIYDYHFASQHLGPAHNSTTGTFTEGWYDKEGHYLSDQNGSWEKGDTYYVNGDTTRKYVPTLDENRLTTQQQNTIYTLYQFATSDASEEKINPSYGKESSVTYHLDDIRIWKQYTGNFMDESGSGAAPDLGYDEALYVNIPKNALPLQVANIELDSAEIVHQYQSNIDEKEHATPFRLFYSVGVQQQILTDDLLNIDVGKLTSEYMSTHYDEDGNTYFYSNYYSNTTYDGYVTDSASYRTRGDSSITFSPSTMNRYYTYQKPLILYEIAEQPTAYQEVDLTSKESYQAFIETAVPITNLQTMSSDKWYHVVLDYYLPHQQNIAHVAVTRLGKEFGSALGDDSIDYGEYLCWYSPSRDEWRALTIEHPQEEGIDDWVVATKPGGIRVGDLSQSIFKKEKNITATANNYYLPTISQNSSSEGDNQYNTIVDGYLGNNGKLLIQDLSLEITKEIETLRTEEIGEEKFTFQVTIPGHQGDYSAIRLLKNPFSNSWQLQINSIDVLTDNQGFLQTEKNRLATYRSEDGKDYYLYVGENSSSIHLDDFVFHLYSNPANQDALERVGTTTYVKTMQEESTSTNKYKLSDERHPPGSIDYWIQDVYLIPRDALQENQFRDHLDQYQMLSEFPISTLNPLKKGNLQISSPYLTHTTYLTETLYFGYQDGIVPAERKENWTDLDWFSQEENRATFTLGANEGILLLGLEENQTVKVRELFSEAQEIKGYQFSRIEGENNEILETGKNYEGTIDASKEALHFVNTLSSRLLIEKKVRGSLGEYERNWNYQIFFRPEEQVLQENYDYLVVKHDNIIRKGTLSLTSQEDGSMMGAFKMTHGETFYLLGLPLDVPYQVVEQEANQDDYHTIAVNDQGTTALEKMVTFTNDRLSKHDLTIGKTVHGKWADPFKEWTLTIHLTPLENSDFKTQYFYEGSREGTIEFLKEEDGTYSQTITLKHDEYMTIKDLPEETVYEIMEEEANQDGYTTTIPSEAKGILGSRKEQEVRFVNTKYSRHQLTIQKRVTGGWGEKDRDFTMQITLLPAPDVTLDEKYSYVGASFVDGVSAPMNGELSLTKQEDGTYQGTISLRHGQQITLQNIPERTQYEVSEKEANQEEYTTTVVGQTKGMLVEENEVVTYINRRLSKHDLTITKQVEGSYQDREKTWNFEVTLIPMADVELAPAYPCTGVLKNQITLTLQPNGSASFQFSLQHEQSLTIQGLPEGTRYEVKELEENRNGFVTEIQGETAAILTAPTTEVKFTNIKLGLQSLTIVKQVHGGDGDVYHDWLFRLRLTGPKEEQLGSSLAYQGGTTLSSVPAKADGVLSMEEVASNVYEAFISLRHGQYVTIPNLPQGTTYELEEVEANQEGYHTTTSTQTKETIHAGLAYIVAFVNERESKQNITIQKQVLGQNADVNRAWNFTLTLTPQAYTLLDETYFYEGTKTGQLTVKKQKNGTYQAQFSLRHGDTMTIQGLPVHTKYSIQEETADEEGYTTSINGESEGILLKEEAPTVQFTNMNLAHFDLTVQKAVKGNASDKQSQWTFKITLMNPYVSQFEPTMVVAENLKEKKAATKNVIGNVEQTISLKDGEKLTLQNIPEGTRYIISELEANQDGYQTTYTDNAYGTLNQKEEVTFTNWKFTKHDLNIQTQLKGNNVEKEKKWTIDVRLVPPEEVPFDTIYPWVNQEGQQGFVPFQLGKDGAYHASFSVAGDDEFTLKGLPYGTQYEVVEVEANQDGYQTTAQTAMTGTLEHEVEKVHIVNSRDGIENPDTFDQVFCYLSFLVLTIVGELFMIVKKPEYQMQNKSKKRKRKVRSNKKS